MASEDVIELGSSEDEAEPVPKKRKHMLDAMVHIPVELPEITIKPQKSAPSLKKGLLAKPITINKTNLKVYPPLNRIKPTSTAVRIPVNNKIVRNDVKSKSASTVKNKVTINPFSVAKTFHKTHVVMKKVPPNIRPRNIIDIRRTNMLNILPPSITVKSVHNADVTIQPKQKAEASGLHKRHRLGGPKRKHSTAGELLTVEIDDEDTSESATVSPLWYLKPEDQTEKENHVEKDNNEASIEVETVEPSMEEKNNMEPDTPKYVEITIEDSPLKPIHSKHPDIGKELTITIEDSPVKPKATDKGMDVDEESDSDMNNVSKDKQSKKMLNYLKISENSKDPKTHVVEIEIDFEKPTSVAESDNKSKLASPKHKQIEEKCLKHKRDMEKVKKDDDEQAKEIINEDCEFHPTYQKFICMCFQLENTDDMKKIVEKKIKAYYRQCPKDYVESEEFIEMISSKIVSMKASPEKMYLFIKDIVDELNLQRKMAKSVLSKEKVVDTEKESSTVKYEDSQYTSKKRRQIRKLEKTIKKLHRAIQKLEEQEVDFDDDEDSVYLLTERYKERMVHVHAKFCQLTNTKMPSEPRIHVEARPGRPTGPAKKLEKRINRKVPIGSPLPFPDFHDVLRCVRDANEEDKLGWNDIDIMEEARDLFTRCGKKLQRRRQENEWRIAASRITTEVDPMEDNSDLKKKLDDNKLIAARRETELFNKYVDRQNLLKLEAEEIGDKEADESPLESEEEAENYNTLEDNQNRKQRIQRLISEKSKKDNDKENDIGKDTEPKDKKETNMKESKDVDDRETEEDKTNNVEMDAESMSNDVETTKDKEEESNTEKEDKEVEINDSDSDRVESDIDELHLLRKKHSENEDTSDLDTLGSYSEGEDEDIISIENSSYSESEMIIDGSSNDDDTNSLNKQNLQEFVTGNFEIEYSSIGIEETNKDAPAVKSTAIEEVEENILLASSDEDANCKTGNVEILDTCINLRDDNISIDENSIPENNNAVVSLLENSPIMDSAKENDVSDNGIKDDIKECTESMDITESTSSEQSDTKDVAESNSQNKVHAIEKVTNDQSAITETINCETSN